MERGNSRRRNFFLVALGLGLMLSACNPLLTDPVSQGGELDSSVVRYTGPSPVWLEVAVTGAGDDTVFGIALVDVDEMQGPSARDCAGPGGAVVACVVTPAFVWMPDQRVVPGDGSAYVRLITLWSGERAEVILVCIDPTTQELGCPDAVRASLRTVDEGGTLTGQLVSA